MIKYREISPIFFPKRIFWAFKEPFLKNFFAIEILIFFNYEETFTETFWGKVKKNV